MASICRTGANHLGIDGTAPSEDIGSLSPSPEPEVQVDVRRYTHILARAVQHPHSNTPALDLRGVSWCGFPYT